MIGIGRLQSKTGAKTTDSMLKLLIQDRVSQTRREKRSLINSDNSEVYRHDNQGGTGLGLSIASGIVEAHGGKLWIDTGDNGHGSNFQFFIPLKKGKNG